MNQEPITQKKAELANDLKSIFFGRADVTKVWAKKGDLVTIIADHGTALVVQLSDGTRVPAARNEFIF